MSSTVLERTTQTIPKKLLTRQATRQLVLSALLALVSFVGVRYGYNWWAVGRFIESTDDAYVGGNVTPISPHIGGFVANILVSDNQHISAGQLLVRLDDRDVQAAADHAEAILRQRTAALGSLRAKYLLQQSAIQEASADLDAKAAQAEFAKDDAERYRSLLVSKAASRQDAQRAFALDQQARAAVTSAQAELAAARQQLTVLEAEIAEAEAAVAQG